MSYSFRVPYVNTFREQLRAVYEHPFVHEFLMITASIAAVIVGVSQFVYNSVTQWYQQSGRDLLLHSITHMHSIGSSLLTLTYDKIAED
jgi:hypothetical protein